MMIPVVLFESNRIIALEVTIMETARICIALVSFPVNTKSIRTAEAFVTVRPLTSIWSVHGMCIAMVFQFMFCCETFLTLWPLTMKWIISIVSVHMDFHIKFSELFITIRPFTMELFFC